MHDQTLMRILDAIADHLEQLQTSGDVQLAPVAPEIDALSFYVIHHEIRQSLFRAPAVNQPGDRRMIERRENIALLAEAAQHVRLAKSGPHNLDGYLLVNNTVIARRQVNRAHPAASEFPQDQIGSHAPPFHARHGILRHARVYGSQKRPADEVRGAFIRDEQFANFAAEVFVALARFREKCRALGWIFHFRGGLIDIANLAEALDGHRRTSRPVEVSYLRKQSLVGLIAQV